MRRTAQFITNNPKQITIAVLLFVISYWLLVAGTAAQTQEQGRLIITWQANNFYPSDFMGKAPAAFRSPVTLAVEMLLNQKLQDLSQADIAWYLDGDFLNRGVGLKETNFVVTKAKGDAHLVRVVVRPTQGQALEKSISLPIVSPKIILENKYPNQLIASQSQISLLALPYFFNVSSLKDLNFSWKVNNQEASGSDNQLILNIGSPRTDADRYLQIEILAKNKKNPFETATARTELFIQ